jgi:hypothetical protein
MQTYRESDAIWEFSKYLNQRYGYRTNLYTETQSGEYTYNYDVKGIVFDRWYKIGVYTYSPIVGIPDKFENKIDVFNMERFLQDDQLKEHEINLRYEELLLVSI